MDKSSQRHSKKVTIWQSIWIFVLFFALIWLMFSSIRMVSTYVEARNNRVSAENQKAKVEGDIEYINDRLDSIKTEKGIEEHIRLKYPFVKDGERVLVISPDTSSENIKKKTLWQKIKSIF